MQRGLWSLALALSACALSTIDEPRAQEASAATLAGAQAIGEAFCHWYYACGCDPGFGPHRDEAECRLHVSTGLTRRLEQGRAVELDHDDTCYADIAAYFEQAKCAGATEVELDAQLRGAFDLMLACKPWSGGAIEGEACAVLPTAKGDDCAPGLICELAFEVCIPGALIAAGQPCGESSLPCEPGLTCAWAADEVERCILPPVRGESCRGEECAMGLWCAPGSSTCEDLPAAGEACVEGGNAYEWACASGSVCATCC